MWEVLAFFKCVDVVLCSSAGDSLEEWQLKYPLQTQLLMDGNLDKRKTNGLNKRARKLLQSKDPETRLHGQMLQAYHSQLELLSNISSKNIKHTTAAELSRWLVLVQEEGLSLTSSQKRALVARKCSLALQAQNFIEVLDIMDPSRQLRASTPWIPSWPTWMIPKERKSQPLSQLSPKIASYQHWMREQVGGKSCLTIARCAWPTSRQWIGWSWSSHQQ